MIALDNLMWKRFVALTASFMVVISFVSLKAQESHKISSESVWKLQAVVVAHSLNLPKEKSDKIVDLYITIRSKLKSEAQKNQEGKDDKSGKESSDIIKNKLRAELADSLERILAPEQLSTAFGLLGSFNARWDSYVSIISEFNLGENKTYDGIQLINEYISEYEKARKAASDSGNRFSSSISRELKSKLDNEISKLFNDNQKSDWNELTLIGKSKK